MTGDNDYEATVYTDPARDERTPALQRALHAELCRGPHADGYPACERAAAVVRRYSAEQARAVLTPETKP